MFLRLILAVKEPSLFLTRLVSVMLKLVSLTTRALKPDVPPPGLLTVILAEPALVIRLDGPVALSEVRET